MTSSPIPVILDVDTGIDDAMALMFAVRHPALDVQAISCVAGNASIERVVSNTLQILDVLGAPEIPVAAGAIRPLVEQARDASWVHGESGLGNLSLPASARTVERVHAVELMRRTIADSAEKITLIALAPLTNLALLLRMHPEVADRIERIVCMGGSASIGNATPVAEFNVWHDPEAAHVVFNSGVPLTLYGLDVFNVVEVPNETVAELHTLQDPVAQALASLLGFEVTDPADGTKVTHTLIGDAGAVCALVAPELVTTEHRRLQVELAPGLSRGQTIVDRRSFGGEESVHGTVEPWPTADVCLGVDVDAVLELILGTVLQK